MRHLIVKGAYYYSPDENTIFKPHYTGSFWAVDCDLYKPKNQIIEEFGETYFSENKDSCIEHEAKKYYYAEYAPRVVGDDWELLSDLSELEHVEQSFDWN